MPGTLQNTRAFDLTGQRFGRLLVVSRAGTRHRFALWSCRCDCGVRAEVRSDSLRRGDTTSCGCRAVERSTTHGHSSGGRVSRVYQSWSGMLQRCLNPDNAAYANYGGRGITVAPQWRTFAAFFADMGHRPRGRSLDRIDNNRGYEPGNCRWATPKQQANNRRAARPRSIAP